MSNSSFSSSVLTIPSNGLGEVNISTNGIALTDTSGWTTSSATLARLTNGSPLDPAIPTGFQAVSTTTTASYVSTVALSVPVSVRNRKLKVQFSQTLTDAASWKIDVFKSDNTTRYPLSTDSSSVSVLPAFSGTFTTTFDMDSDTAIYVRFTRHAGAGTSTLNFTNLIVGTGIQPQGAVAGGWQSITITLTASTTNPTATTTGRFRRVGDSMELSVSTDTITNVGSGTWEWSLPSDYTINQAQLTGTTLKRVGEGNFYDSSAPANSLSGPIYVNTAGKLRFYADGFGNFSSGTTGLSAGASDEVGFDCVLPISEWAGSGTVNLAQNDVEYAYNTSGITTAGASDTTSFGYGPAGAAIGAIDAATVTAASVTVMRVRFQTPIQPTDELILEITNAEGKWIPVGLTNVCTFVAQGAARYGAGISLVSGDANAVDVHFGNGGRANSNTTYGLAGASWSSFTGGRWRVKKVSGGAAVGFGIVTPGTSAGLVSASGLPANTTGNAIASGYVGEYKSASCSANTVINAAADTYVDIPGLSLTLEAGVWMINYNVAIGFQWVVSSLTANVSIALTNSANVVQPFFIGFIAQRMEATTNNITQSLSRSGVLVVPSTTTYKVRGRASLASTSTSISVFTDTITGGLTDPDNASTLYAVRVA